MSKITLKDVSEFPQFKAELEKQHCKVIVVQGMATRGFSFHDIDILISQQDQATISNVVDKLSTFSEEVKGKYGLTIEAMILDNRGKIHLFASDRKPLLLYDIERLEPLNPVLRLWIKTQLSQLI